MRRVNERILELDLVPGIKGRGTLVRERYLGGEGQGSWSPLKWGFSMKKQDVWFRSCAGSLQMIRCACRWERYPGACST
jgi:hypothetical protein